MLKPTQKGGQFADINESKLCVRWWTLKGEKFAFNIVSKQIKPTDKYEDKELLSDDSFSDTFPAPARIESLISDWKYTFIAL